MARTVKTAEARQDEILDVAARLFMRDGYAETSIQAIIDEIGIAKGTFYHHYPSKSALLDGLVTRMVGQMMAFVTPIVANSELTAIDKLNRVYQGSVAWKVERMALMLEFARALNADGNVLLMRRVERDSAAAFVPKLAVIIDQGVREGVFVVRHPEPTARIVYQLGMVFASVRDALIDDARPLPPRAEIEAQIAAFHDAVSRVLGAEPGLIRLLDSNDFAVWLDAETKRRCA